LSSAAAAYASHCATTIPVPKEKPYRRRRGVIWRPGKLGVPRELRYGPFWQSVWVNDGGEDAALSRRGRTNFWCNGLADLYPRCLIDLINASVGQGCSALSLSVREENPARGLYESVGFVCLRRHGSSWTMIRHAAPSN
jgi:hypothetical protein